MKLLALRCPECGNSLTPENDDIVVTCARCFTAVQIGDEGLSQMAVFYVRSKSRESVTRWLPFWVFRGTVQISQRETQGGGSQEQEALRFWSQPRAFYVPAWEMSVPSAQEIGSGLMVRQPDVTRMAQPPPAALAPVTLAPADAVKMLEFIVLAIEADRSDWLKSINFQLDVGEPELLAFPAGDAGLLALD